MGDDLARQAFDEARELFYAARLASTATSQPIHVAPLLKHCILMLCRALAATAGVSSTKREDVIAAVEALDAKEQVLEYPVLRQLGLLDDLERRGQELSAAATAEEAREIARLVDAMPSLLVSARRRIAFRGRAAETRARRRRINRLAVVIAALGLCALVVAALTLGRWGYDVAVHRNVYGAYYIGTDFDRFAFARRDGAIDFGWGTEAPSAALPADGFSIRWDGTLLVSQTGRYTFVVESDDGARLFVDDQLLIDNWNARGPSERQASVSIEAGHVPIRLDYRDVGGPAFVRLLWSPPGAERSVVGGGEFVR